MITPFDDAPKNAFLEKFQPKDGTTYRVYILDWNNKVELSFHYLEKTKDAAGNEIPGGMYTCDSAECCAILGAPSSKLMLPIWLYTSPDNDVNAGQLFSWDVPREQYKALVELKKKLASQNDNIANYDFQITAKDQGKGVRIQVMPLPPPRDPQSGQYYNGSSYLLLFATPEIRQQAFDSVATWLTLADTTTFRKVPLGGWRGVLEKHHVPMIAGVGNVPMAGGQRAPGLAPPMPGQALAPPQGQGYPPPGFPPQAQPQTQGYPPPGFPPQAQPQTQGYPPQGGFPPQATSQGQGGYPPGYQQPAPQAPQPAMRSVGPVTPPQGGYPSHGQPYGTPPPAAPAPQAYPPQGQQYPPQAADVAFSQPAGFPPASPLSPPQAGPPAPAFREVDVSADDLKTMMDTEFPPRQQ